jgi:hypothetical protein
LLFFVDVGVQFVWVCVVYCHKIILFLDHQKRTFCEGFIQFFTQQPAFPLHELRKSFETYEQNISLGENFLRFGLALQKGLLHNHNFWLFTDFLGQIEYLIAIIGDDGFKFVLEVDELILGVERIDHLSLFSSEDLFQLSHEIVIAFAIDFIDQ